MKIGLVICAILVVILAISNVWSYTCIHGCMHEFIDEIYPYEKENEED